MAESAELTGSSGQVEAEKPTHDHEMTKPFKTLLCRQSLPSHVILCLIFLSLSDDADVRSGAAFAQRYLETCLWTGTIPVRCYLRHVGEASLNMNHYGLGPQDAKALVMVLQHDRNVKALELEDNRLGAVGAEYLMLLLQKNSNIQSLNLSNNQLGLEGAKIITEILLENYYVKSIKLSGNKFDDSAVKYIAGALEGDFTLKELDLSHNMFFDEGGEHLGRMLAKNVGIEVLNLSWNGLRMSGAVALCDGLKVNQTLKQLHLASNGFCSIVANSLGQALKSNRELVLLDLSSNRIDDQAVELLCQGLGVNSTLRILKLSHNPMTSAGALTLLTTVHNHMKSALEEIDMRTVFVCETFVELLDDVHKMRPCLDVPYSVMTSVTRNLSALPIFQKFFEDRNESIRDFFQALDKDGTMRVTTADFRKAVQAVNIPLDQQQLEWLVQKLDSECMASICYRCVWKPLEDKENTLHHLSAASCLRVWATGSPRLIHAIQK
ncbi:leucine-rich repeat-containing protein 74A-like [Sphaeramia orbicularis]|uniref:leucine-rich repeat-containing protein 74A-like n=1 Tax=Sphaeramia orbicularis TaxID=375764 RepID=UPI00117ED7D9|nr:leucine-rich repeat-containing protein 74A-like [Sphaeramia orbicularis]